MALQVGPNAPAIAGKSIVQAAAVLNPRLPRLTEFNVVGQGSIVQASVPASVPVWVRRGALAGVLGKDAVSGVLSRFTVGNSFLGRLFGRQPMIVQRVVSTSPSTLLLAAPTNQTLTVLEMDGSVDWAVVYPATLHAHAGESLNIIPRTAVGGLVHAVPFSHISARGRGVLALASPSQLLRVTLEAGESMLVQRSHLAAFSIDGNAAGGKPRFVDVSFALAPDPDAHAVTPRRSFGNPTVDKAVYTTLELTRQAFSWLKRAVRRGAAGRFVEMHGPCTILVTAQAPVIKK
ncbi:Altered inheritance of mitochondria protein 24, mitochondrial [Wickerhamiella sorbophila]|uniref:Altered inheritance of mitochondria protein 24, mitochondrial n=1 Tax=Wickerhamiella sorbophila TaxID=45607 RepID=A0A2T0FIG6_9ASCO|nr:Altered inheritance of mitochondria protein 24, mitochondrial [Wickerhamiella sorbophila]PRT54775.1 Altered inheritance of mitochondria protein 24, mitochondrial [Wickerhamiella sorbophila]